MDWGQENEKWVPLWVEKLKPKIRNPFLVGKGASWLPEAPLSVEKLITGRKPSELATDLLNLEKRIHSIPTLLVPPNKRT